MDYVESVATDNVNMFGLSINLSIIIIVLLVLDIILIGLVIFLMVRTKRQGKNFKRFMAGSRAESLEDAIAKLFTDNKRMKYAINDNTIDIQQLYKKLTKTFQKIGLVKYDAYQQMGGKLSFSLALLDEYDNGFILNSVHSSHGCYTYTKEIIEGRCELELGNEEKIALEQAIGRTDY